jgi:hypothetical protein
MRNAVRVAQLHMLRNLEEFRVMLDMAWKAVENRAEEILGRPGHCCARNTVAADQLLDQASDHKKTGTVENVRVMMLEACSTYNRSEGGSDGDKRSRLTGRS